MEISGIEPLTSCVQGRRSPSWAISPMSSHHFLRFTYYSVSISLHRLEWWVWVDLNHRPHPYQGCALTTWATDPKGCLRSLPCLQLPNNLCEHLLSLHLGKEVIQPQVPLRLPCYDFTPVMNHTVVNAPLSVKLSTSGTTHSHGVTGGVYKARERIHRDILIRDY